MKIPGHVQKCKNGISFNLYESQKTSSLEEVILPAEVDICTPKAKALTSENEIMSSVSCPSVYRILCKKTLYDNNTHVVHVMWFYIHLKLNLLLHKKALVGKVRHNHIAGHPSLGNGFPISTYLIQLLKCNYTLFIVFNVFVMFVVFKNI